LRGNGRPGMWRRNVSALLAVAMFVIALCGTPSASAEEVQSDTLGIEAASAILIDAATGQVLYEKNADEVRPPASMTKMMTELIVLERIANKDNSWEEIVSVSKEAASTPADGSQIYLAEGDQHSIKDLYIAMAVGSANDATIALATHIAGTEQAFVELMNKKAQEIGLATAKYTGATGLQETTVISARDQAKLAMTILRDRPEFLDYSKLIDYKFRERDKKPMINWNWMLEGNKDVKSLKQFAYPGVDGMKTGYISKAGYCFTGTVKKGDLRLISVVMGTSSEKARFRETKKLFDYGLNSFEMKTVVQPKSVVESVQTVNVKKGKKKTVPVVTENDISFLVKKGTEPKMEVIGTTLVDEKELTAPLDSGTKVGTVTYAYTDDSGKKIEKTVNLITTEKVGKASWWRLMFRGIGGFFAGLFKGITG